MGSAAAASFLADGFRVFAADVRAVEAQAGLMPVALDVRDRAAVFALAERAAADSDLRTWINCAGVVSAARIEDAEAAEWDRILTINLTGVFHCCAAALAVMRRAAPPGGRIVNAGSISGQIGGVSLHPAYGASKAGVHALTKSYAVAGARYGIYCNAIAPSVIEGRMAAAFAPVASDAPPRAHGRDRARDPLSRRSRGRLQQRRRARAQWRLSQHRLSPRLTIGKPVHASVR
jgi:NAD(P)-dependent dehydrogenase (short-subunit alcohol dehydrogenase family)